MALIPEKQALNNLYEMLIELNLYRTQEDTLVELNENPDPQIEKHLIYIKQLNTRLRANANKNRYQRAIEQLKLLKEKGIDELINLFPLKEHNRLMPLFRKLEHFSPQDETSVVEEQEILQFMEILKNRINDDTDC